MRWYIRKIVRNDYLMLAMGLVICIDSFGEVWHVLVEFSLSSTKLSSGSLQQTKR